MGWNAGRGRNVEPRWVEHRMAVTWEDVGYEDRIHTPLLSAMQNPWACVYDFYCAQMIQQLPRIQWTGRAHVCTIARVAGDTSLAVRGDALREGIRAAEDILQDGDGAHALQYVYAERSDGRGVVTDALPIDAITTTWLAVLLMKMLQRRKTAAGQGRAYLAKFTAERVRLQGGHFSTLPRDLFRAVRRLFPVLSTSVRIVHVQGSATEGIEARYRASTDGVVTLRVDAVGVLSITTGGNPVHTPSFDDMEIDMV